MNSDHVHCSFFDREIRNDIKTNWDANSAELNEFNIEERVHLATAYPAKLLIRL